MSQIKIDVAYSDEEIAAYVKGLRRANAAEELVVHAKAVLWDFRASLRPQPQNEALPQ